MISSQTWKNLRILLNIPNYSTETTSVLLLWYRYHFIPFAIVIYVSSLLLDHKLFEGRVMSGLSLNFLQGQEERITHNRCSVKAHWINSISKSASPRKRKFQVWSSGKWFGVCFILMMNAIRRWSLGASPSLISRMCMPLWVARGTMPQTDLQISRQVSNAPFSVDSGYCLSQRYWGLCTSNWPSVACQWSIFKNHNDLLTLWLKLYISRITNLSYLFA